MQVDALKFVGILPRYGDYILYQYGYQILRFLLVMLSKAFPEPLAVMTTLQKASSIWGDVANFFKIFEAVTFASFFRTTGCDGYSIVGSKSSDRNGQFHSRSELYQYGHRTLKFSKVMEEFLEPLADASNFINFRL